MTVKIINFIMGTVLMLLACDEAAEKDFKTMWFDIIISLTNFAVAIWW